MHPPVVETGSPSSGTPAQPIAGFWLLSRKARFTVHEKSKWPNSKSIRYADMQAVMVVIIRFLLSLSIEAHPEYPFKDEY